VGLQNRVFEQVLDVIVSATGEVVHERVVGLFIENALPSNFLLVFGSGATVNLNAEVQKLVVIDKTEGDEPCWIQLQGIFNYYWVEDVDICNSPSSELYLKNVTQLFIHICLFQ
jgi:hypothetical protein